MGKGGSMNKQIVTMKQRLEYLAGIYRENYARNITFPQFMECLFSKLENEIRDKASGIDRLQDEGEGDKKPVSDQTVIFEYDYER